MTQPHKRNQGTYPNKHGDSSNLATNQEENLPNINQTTKYEDKSQKRHNITEDVVIVNKEKWTRADKISGVALVVNALLAFFTYQLYHTAVHDSNTADTSAKAAVSAATISQKTFEATKKYNDSSLAIQQKVFGETKQYNTGTLDIQQRAFKSSNIDNKERFKRDTMALGLQIQSIRQSQEQFIKQNEPYLQVYIDSIKIINKREEVIYTLANLTPIPVKIISQKGSTTISAIQPIAKSTVLRNIDDINFYVIKESPQTRKFTLVDTLSETQIKWIKDSYYSTFLTCEISYQNLISGKIKTYKFEVKITKLKNSRTYYEFISNENSQEK